MEHFEGHYNPWDPSGSASPGFGESQQHPTMSPGESKYKFSDSVGSSYHSSIDSAQHTRNSSFSTAPDEPAAVQTTTMFGHANLHSSPKDSLLQTPFAQGYASPPPTDTQPGFGYTETGYGNISAAVPPPADSPTENEWAFLSAAADPYPGVDFASSDVADTVSDEAEGVPPEDEAPSSQHPSPDGQQVDHASNDSYNTEANSARPGAEATSAPHSSPAGQQAEAQQDAHENGHIPGHLTPMDNLPTSPAPSPSGVNSNHNIGGQLTRSPQQLEDVSRLYFGGHSTQNGNSQVIGHANTGSFGATTESSRPQSPTTGVLKIKSCFDGESIAPGHNPFAPNWNGHGNAQAYRAAQVGGFSHLRSHSMPNGGRGSQYPRSQASHFNAPLPSQPQHSHWPLDLTRSEDVATYAYAHTQPFMKREPPDSPSYGHGLQSGYGVGLPRTSELRVSGSHRRTNTIHDVPSFEQQRQGGGLHVNRDERDDPTRNADGDESPESDMGLADESILDDIDCAPRCLLVTDCTTGSCLRKGTSHIIGRNKLCTRLIPDRVFVHMCRKHYQRRRYRNRVAFARPQCLLVMKQLERVQRWSNDNAEKGLRFGILEYWTLNVRKREKLRREGQPPKKIKYGGTPYEREELQSYSPLNYHQVPEWLLEKCGRRYTTEQGIAIFREIFDRLLDPEDPLEIIPDIEILPSITYDPNTVSQGKKQERQRRLGEQFQTAPKYNVHTHSRSELVGHLGYQSPFVANPGSNFWHNDMSRHSQPGMGYTPSSWQPRSAESYTQPRASFQERGHFSGTFNGGPTPPRARPPAYQTESDAPAFAGGLRSHRMTQSQPSLPYLPPVAPGSRFTSINAPRARSPPHYPHHALPPLGGSYGFRTAAPTGSYADSPTPRLHSGAHSGFSHGPMPHRSWQDTAHLEGYAPAGSQSYGLAHQSLGQGFFKREPEHGSPKIDLPPYRGAPT